MSVERQPGAPLRIAVLISGSGSNLQALIDVIESREMPGAEIALVVSNRADAYGLQRALQHKLPALYLPWRDKAQAEAKLARILHLFQIDLIVLSGWMRILSAEFINQFPDRIINQHPALLPPDGLGDTCITSAGHVIPALRGLHVVRRALEAGMPVTGCVVHYVIPQVDAGRVICQAEVPIIEGDTEESLHERIKQFEHRLIVEAVRKFIKGGVQEIASPPGEVGEDSCNRKS
ncbi:MAG: phosphoribosylglycinamide formyltransferase [Ktedonobacteraceae bacterium]|nr:phosphoribosylglycinamide formyltransferase [Ktedonobacteraceae bacterium]